MQTRTVARNKPTEFSLISLSWFIKRKPLNLVSLPENAKAFAKMYYFLGQTSYTIEVLKANNEIIRLLLSFVHI